MLVLLLLWSLILIISFLYGFAATQTLPRLILGIQEKIKVHFSLQVLLGFIVLAFVTSAFSLFIKIGALADGLVLLGALAIAVGSADFTWTGRTSFWPYGALAIFLALPALMLSAMPSESWDDGLYYIQNIKWIETYPAVPGLGNLHGRFAFNSSWHTLQALFGLRWFQGTPLYDQNGLLYILFCIYAVDALRLWRKAGRALLLSDALKMLLPAAHFSLTIFLTAPTADLPIFYLVWMSFLLFVEKHERNSLAKADVHFFLILSLVLFAMTVKLSSAFLAALPVYLVLRQISIGQWRRILPLAVFTIVFLAPWLARNVILSGYLVYPFHQLDVFNFDWEIPRVDMEHMNCLITNWAKNRELPCNVVAEQSMAEWVPVWFSNVPAIFKLMVGHVLVGIPLYLGLLGLGLLRKGRAFLQEQEGLIVVVGVLYLGFLFWFTSSPNLRFGLGVNLFFLLLTVGLGVRLALKWVPSRFWALSMISLMLVPHLKLYHNITALDSPVAVAQKYAVYPAPDVAHRVAPWEEADFLLYKPTAGQRCWDAPLPCTCYTRTELEMRTGKLEDGFKTILQVGKEGPTYW